MSKIGQEFKDFICRGNVVDMAVGVVVGSAFTGIVNSLVNDVIMPAVGCLLGGMDFSNFKIVLKAAEGEAAEVAIKYGAFINSIINFLILAFVIFCVVKAINNLHKKPEPEPEPVPEDPKPTAEDLLTEIRDLLKKD